MRQPNMDWLGKAWDDYLDNLGSLLPLTLLQAALTLPLFLAVEHWGSLVPAAAYALLFIAPFTVGVNLFYIRLARGERPGLAEVFSAFPVYPRALAVTMLLGTATLSGALLFLLPGLLIYSMYCFSEFAVVDRRTGVRESFRLSARLTDGWKFPLSLLVILMFAADAFVKNPVYFLGWEKPQLAFDLGRWALFAFALKTLVFLPWLRLALARAYVLLLGLHEGRAPAEPAPEDGEQGLD